VRRSVVAKRDERSVASPTQAVTHAAFDPDLRHRMISEGAYYLYTQRGYTDGFDLDDWLMAEGQVDALIMNPEQEETREVTAPLASP
jgi:hypothetical protein